MNNQKIAQRHRQIAASHNLIADEFESGGIVNPTHPPVDNPDSGPTPQPPSGNKIPVRILFFGLNHSYKKPIDIMINGVWYDFSIEMDVKFHINQAVGTIIWVDGPIRTIQFPKSQIKFDGLNGEGFGNTNFKYGAVPVGNADLPAEQDMMNVSDSFWSVWVHGKANHTSYWGAHDREKDATGKYKVDPEFYKIDVRPDFNDSGRFAIYASGYGENAPGR